MILVTNQIQNYYLSFLVLKQSNDKFNCRKFYMENSEKKMWVWYWFCYQTVGFGPKLCTEMEFSMKENQFVLFIWQVKKKKKFLYNGN